MKHFRKIIFLSLLLSIISCSKKNPLSVQEVSVPQISIISGSYNCYNFVLPYLVYMEMDKNSSVSAKIEMTYDDLFYTTNAVDWEELKSHFQFLDIPFVTNKQAKFKSYVKIRCFDIISDWYLSDSLTCTLQLGKNIISF